MKYFIRKRKDCISSFCLQGERKKNGGGALKKTFFFGNYCVCVCDEWRGSARIGCWWKREVEKMSKTVTLCRRLWKRKFDEVKLSLLEI